MGKFSKRQRKAPDSDSGSQEESEAEEMLEDKSDDGGGEYSDDSEEEKENIDGDGKNDMTKDTEMEEVEKELTYIQQKDRDLLRNLKRHKDEDFLKGQAVKNQKAIWDKTLEFRFLLQKAFSSSNRLPKEPLKSSFCDIDGRVNEAYSELLASSKKTLDSLLELQEALIENNPSVARARDGNSGQPLNHSEATRSLNGESDPEWSHISEMHSRIAPFRNESIDKWQRKTQATIAAAAIKGKLHAFNQNVSEQVAGYMRDPSRMIKGMQQSRSTVAVFGIVPDADHNTKDEDRKVDGDPELLDDSEFYQQLLKEFFETFDPTSSETAFYALKRMQTKKRKIVDRRASKSRKIRYHVHEKIVNFMSPQPMQLPPMAPKLFENLFGLRTRKLVSVE